jgi:glyoxylase-like metal-dependent hydrolase (beta-lactamase superfamily II)
MLRIGSFDIVSVQTGTFRLDGGAMFGVVPKVMWGPHEDVDDQNRMLLATRSLLAVSENRRVVMVVDSGAGTKWTPEAAGRFSISHDGEAISRALERFRLTAHDVTDVVVTHLHFDHNGGLTSYADEGRTRTRLNFPNARHWMTRRHWEHANHPTERDAASFVASDFEALAPAGVLELVDGDFQSSPDAPWEGVAFWISDGHTPGQLSPIFRDDSQELIWTGDACPTSSHLRVPWVMAYDLEPLKTIREKKWLLERRHGHGAALAFPHDHRLGGGTIDFVNGRPFVGKVLDLD